MIAIPLFADQYMNVDFYVKKKIAVKIDLLDINEKSFTKALEMIIKNKIYKYAKSLY